eukprot:gene10569-30785_t
MGATASLILEKAKARWKEIIAPYTLEGAALASSLLRAARYNEITTASRLLEYGYGADVETSTYDGRTAIMFAAQDGRVGTVQFLIAHGANVNRADEDGHTPLHCSSVNGHLSTVGLLLDNGAEVNQECHELGNTAAMYAAQIGATLICLELLDRGGAIDPLHLTGAFAPLHRA